MTQHWREITPSWILLYEEALLQGLAATLPDEARVVNIGAGAGTSVCALLRGLAHLGDARVWSVDIDAAMLERERTAVEAQGLDQARLDQICGPSADVGRGWEGRKLDLIFVDGAHNYAGVSADLAAWTPHIRPGGLLVCHDFRDTKQRETTRAILDWHRASRWLEVGRVLYTVAYAKPGGDEEWKKGRVK